MPKPRPLPARDYPALPAYRKPAKKPPSRFLRGDMIFHARGFDSGIAADGEFACWTKWSMGIGGTGRVPVARPRPVRRGCSLLLIVRQSPCSLKSEGNRAVGGNP